MNDPISRQLPLMNAGVSSRYIERPLKPEKVDAAIETDKSRSMDDASAGHGNIAEVIDGLSEKVEQLNMQLQKMQRSLQFSVDDSSGRIVVKVIDMETDEVIRQIPSEEMLAIIRNAGDSQNVIFNDEA